MCGMKGITLIGMPGAGKSTIGKQLAKKLDYYFLDLDVFIKEKEGRSHAEIAKAKGDAELLRLEEECALGLTLDKTVFSPGGSIVYSEPAMDKLQKETEIFYLELPFTEIQRRLGRGAKNRGIIGLPGQGLAEKGLQGLYDERSALYKKFAHHIINCHYISDEEVVKQIHAIL